MGGYTENLRESADRSIDDLPSTCEKLHCDDVAKYAALFNQPPEWVAYCGDCFDTLSDGDNMPSAVMWEYL